MFIHRLFFYVGGLAILTFGAAMTIKANFGAGPWDALNVALSETVGLTVGGWSILIGLLLILINALLAKKNPEISGAITVAVSGIFIDAWLLGVFKTFEPVEFFSRLGSLLMGLLLIALGIATYLQAKWPLSPIDDLMIVVKDRYKVTLGVAKTIGEVLALSLAILFHGPVGLGTFVVGLGIGPFISLFHSMWERLYFEK